MTGPAPELAQLMALMAKVPGLGPRSARRAVLHMLKKRDSLMQPLATALASAAATVKACTTCGALDTRDPCGLCTDPKRDPAAICVVRDMGDVWALERAGAHGGCYHVLGGLISALDGVSADDLGVDKLIARLIGVTEVILALPATVDGQMTAHYLVERIKPSGVRVTSLAYGAPVGGEIEGLDDGTLAIALCTRREM
jgi:recombination protein RecR